MNKARTIATTVGVTSVVALLLGATWIYSGIFDVSAAGRQGGVVAAVLGTLADRSIESHAPREESPRSFTPADMEEAAETFHAQCVTCHSGPGVPRGVIGEGMNPLARELSERVAGERTEAQLYWVIANGIRFTGMPGFSQSRSEDEMWALARFVKEMDGMTSQEYEAIFRAIMAKNGGVMPGSGPGHSHPAAPPPSHTDSSGMKHD